MENNQSQGFLFKTQQVAQNTSNFFSDKNTLIIILITLLILSLLGINILHITGNFVQAITNIFGPFITQLLSFFGYTTGSVISKTADVVGDTTKTGVDIATGTIKDVGDLLKNASQGQINTDSKASLDRALNDGSKIDFSKPPSEPSPNASENPIQKPISSNKNTWCLVGEYQEKRGCISIDEHDKCLSGQVFPSQQMCLNPNLSANV
jgi:hypothetical protein